VAAPVSSQTADEGTPTALWAGGSDLDRLAREAATGDAAVVGKLFIALTPMLVRYCRGKLGRQQRSYRRADEIAREVGRAVLDALPGYDHRRGSFLRLVHAIAAHKLEGVPASQDQAGKPELTDLMHALPPMDREILVLRVAAGLSVAETAEVVGLTPAQVRVVQHQALAYLRALLDGGTTR
jgi:RNA polymerase sigma-70 factor, ECF subfamily